MDLTFVTLCNLFPSNIKFIHAQNYKCNQIPICYSEFDPGTEYGHLKVGPDNDLSTDPKRINRPQ